MEVNRFNFFSNLTLGIKNNVSKINHTIFDIFHPHKTSLTSPDELFLSNSAKPKKNAGDFSFDNSLPPLNITPVNNSHASEKLKNVTTKQLKSAGASNKKEFFNILLPAAKESEKKYGVPASVTLAQAALESGWGKSIIGGYNIFGVKGRGPAGTANVPTKEFIKGRWISTTDNFAKYNNFHESIMKHGQVFQLNYPGYKKGLHVYSKTKNDYAFVDAVGHTYATDPDYSKSVKQIMREYKLVELSKNYTA